MFVPQVVLAITAAALSPVWARRWSLQRVLQAGLVANCLAMLLLVLSQVFSTTAAAYPILLCATGALGFGFGCTVPALNTFAARLDPARQDRSVLTLNALLGTGTALAPLLIAVFLALGAWWLLPVLAAVALAGFIVAAVRTPLDAGPPPPPRTTGATRVRLPGTVLVVRRRGRAVRDLRDPVRELVQRVPDRGAGVVRADRVAGAGRVLGLRHRRPGHRRRADLEGTGAPRCT